MEKINIKNAYLNNLKNINLGITKNQFTVITGISGSGKSSLAFHLIFEEGRKRYLQSLGIGVDLGEGQFEEISGLSPTIAVKQNMIKQSNPRSTVGTKTGLLNALNLLYANESKTKEREPSRLSAGDYSYLSPSGMCFSCGGSGKKYAIKLESVITDSQTTVRQVFERIGATKGYLNLMDRKYGELFDQSFLELNEDDKSDFTYGVFDPVSGKTSYCIERILQNRQQKKEEISNLYYEEKCTGCDGFRISREAMETFIDGKHLGELAEMSLNQLYQFLEKVKDVSELGKSLIHEMNTKIRKLLQIKLGHLSLYREMRTLSGGELQRIFLYGHLESNLNGLIYVFDEPTSGLHESEKEMIISSLKNLSEQGNTVLVVSHDHVVIKEADELIEIGPKAGSEGGNVVFKGTAKEYQQLPYTSANCDLTQIISPIKSEAIEIIRTNKAVSHNLKNVSVDIPLNRLVSVIGVSGSGKSSLISDTLVPRLKTQLKDKNPSKIKNVVEVNQAPIGRKSNSTPASYLGIWDKIRELYASQEMSKTKELKAGHFSFNSKGACPTCKGTGVETISLGMDVSFEKICPTCLGKRFNKETLEVTYLGNDIHDCLNLSVSEACHFLEGSGLNLKPLVTLEKIGMGYLKLGQPTSSLSGGEAQRLKLVKEIGKSRQGETLYVLDEPSTGLSTYDISKLLYLINELLTLGHSVIVIEHQIDVIKASHWLIEMGSGAGELGGELIAEGTVEEIKNNPKSLTGGYL